MPDTATTPLPVSTPPRGRRNRRRLLRVAAAAIAVLVGVFLLATAAVVDKAGDRDTTRTDAIVVLGASQYWGEPSPVLANRLDHAAQLYHDGVAPLIVTVGGGIPGDKTTEADAGAAYLQGRGVPADAVVAVTTGSDTLQSLEAVAARASRQGWQQITVVSDRAHLARSSAIASALGFTVHANAPASGDGSAVTPAYVAKESLGLLRFQLWDRWQLPQSIAG